MLRKLLWTALYSVLATLATLAARKVAERLYRILTGETPPAKKA